MKKKSVYADYNATTPLLAEISQKIPALIKNWGNASSSYKIGRAAKELIENARYTAADLFQCGPEHIIFTSSGSEANNLYLQSIGIEYVTAQHPTHIITSSIEHPCILNTCKFLESRGVSVTYVDPDNTGIINPKHIQSHITAHTRAISIMSANNETGALQPIADIAQIAKHHHIHFHTDMIQAIGKIDMTDIIPHCDAITISGHKLYALKGAGILMTRHPKTLNKLIHGGPQESQHRAGTENTLAIATMGMALEKVQKNPRWLYVSDKMDYLKERLINAIPNSHINTPDLYNGNTLNISFLGCSAESMVMACDLEGLYISTGSACSTGSTNPSHVLSAMRLSNETVSSAIRISLSPLSTKDELDYIVNTLIKVIENLRSK